MDNSHLEVEVTFIAKIKNITDLKKAQSIEEQEQYDLWSLDPNTNERVNKVRVRRSKFNNQEDSTYKLYSKNFEANGIQEESKEIVITKEIFDVFKKSANGNGLHKFRHRFIVTDMDKLPLSLKDAELYWEIDVFPLDKDMNFDNWVKIDLELPADTKERIEDLKIIDKLPALPMKFTEIYSLMDKNKDSFIETKFKQWNAVIKEVNEQKEELSEVSNESFSHLGIISKKSLV